MRDRGHPDDLLSAFLDDELDEPDALRVAHHLAACRDCAGELDGLRSMRTALRDLPDVPPPPHLLAEVPDAAAADAGTHRLRLAVGGGVAVVGVVLGLAFAMGATEDGEVVPPVDVVVVDHVVRTNGGPMIQPLDLDR
jgi:anti-sigma factor RsiW